MTVTTRGGTNDYHGAIYDYFQNSTLNAKDPFTHQKNFLIGNTFGGFFGGPLGIPHLYNAKNKTFFYFDYEGTRRPRSTIVSETVPPDNWRKGDFSSICQTGFTAGICNDRDKNGQTIHQLTNPFTGAPFANNQITTQISPTATAILAALFPTQNVAGAADSMVIPVSRHNNLGHWTNDEVVTLAWISCTGFLLLGDPSPRAAHRPVSRERDTKTASRAGQASEHR